MHNYRACLAFILSHSFSHSYLNSASSSSADISYDYSITNANRVSMFTIRVYLQIWSIQRHMSETCCRISGEYRTITFGWSDWYTAVICCELWCRAVDLKMHLRMMIKTISDNDDKMMRRRDDLLNCWSENKCKTKFKCAVKKNCWNAFICAVEHIYWKKYIHFVTVIWNPNEFGSNECFHFFLVVKAFL